MNLNDTQLKNYKDRIKFSIKDKQRYQTQIDYLVSSIETKILEFADTKVIKVLQCGSWKKNTILKPKDEACIDIDLVFFLDINEQDYATLFHAND